jgi:hypothetical protein
MHKAVARNQIASVQIDPDAEVFAKVQLAFSIAVETESVIQNSDRLDSR